MPHPARSDVDWSAVKADYESGEAKTTMARRYKVRRQSIDDRAKTEGWQRDAKARVKGVGKANRDVIDQPEPVPAYHDTISPDDLPELIKTTDAYTKHCLAKGQAGQARHWSPAMIEQACRLALQGATWGMVADACGVTVQALKARRDGDVGLDNLLRACHATHAARRLHNVNDAADRGDLRAAVWALEHGPYRHEIADAGPRGGGPAVTVVLNINDPEASQDAPAHALTIDAAVGDQ